MKDFTLRTEALLGADSLNFLRNLRVAVLGLGGVGAAAAEGILRVGVNSLFLADNSIVKPSNLNRQLIATCETLGEEKTEAAKNRYLSINPHAEITICNELLLPENMELVFNYNPDCIIDAIDNITAKIFLAVECKKRGIPLFSSMGTGGRLNPTELRCGDIKDTVGTSCALSRIMRRELKKHGIDSLPVVYSLEVPSKAVINCHDEGEDSSIRGKHPPASSPFVPPAAGYALSSLAVTTLLKSKNI